MQEEASLMHHVMQLLRHYQDEKNQHSGQKWKLPPCGQPISLFSASCSENRTIIRPTDDSNNVTQNFKEFLLTTVYFSVIFRVYCADHTYCTLRLPFSASAETIKLCAADKLKLRQNDDLLLVEVKSTGERVVFKDEDIGIPTALSLNGRIFVSPKDHLDALVRFLS